MSLPADFPPETRSGYVVLSGRKTAHLAHPIPEGTKRPVAALVIAWCGKAGIARSAPYHAQRCRVCEHNKAEAAKRQAVSA